MIESMLEPLVASRFLCEDKYRRGHIRVINPVEGRRILGVHVPDMKNLAKKLISSEADALCLLRRFKACHDADPFSLVYEEMVIWGLMIDYLKLSWEDRSELLRQFIPAIDNWAVCDTFCSNAKWVRDKEALWEFLSPYWQSDSEFEVRFAVVMSMTSLLSEKYFPLICRKFESLDIASIKSRYIFSGAATNAVSASLSESTPANESKGHIDGDTTQRVDNSGGIVEDKNSIEGYGTVKGLAPHYVNMAIAWFLATALAKFPHQTREYVNATSLPDHIIRLYIRKAKESFRTRDISPL